MAQAAKKGGNTGQGKLLYKKYLYHIVVLAFACALYLNTVPNGYNLDDELVANNHKYTSQGLAAIPEIWSSPYYADDMGYTYDYRPVVLTSFAIEHQFFGENPHASHLFNALLYALLCCCIFLVLVQLWGQEYAVFCLAVSLLFAAHPVHTEVVASIKNRDELFALLFSVLATLYAVKFTDSRKWYFLPLMFFLFVAGLLSKISGLSFAFLIPATLILFKKAKLGQILLVGNLLVLPVLLLINLPYVLQRVWLFMAFNAALLLFYYLITVSILLLVKQLAQKLQGGFVLVGKSIWGFVKGRINNTLNTISSVGNRLTTTAKKIKPPKPITLKAPPGKVFTKADLIILLPGFIKILAIDHGKPNHHGDNFFIAVFAVVVTLLVAMRILKLTAPQLFNALLEELKQFAILVSEGVRKTFDFASHGGDIVKKRTEEVLLGVKRALSPKTYTKTDALLFVIAIGLLASVFLTSSPVFIVICLVAGIIASCFLNGVKLTIVDIFLTGMCFRVLFYSDLSFGLIISFARAWLVLKLFNVNAGSKLLYLLLLLAFWVVNQMYSSGEYTYVPIQAGLLFFIFYKQKFKLLFYIFSCIVIFSFGNAIFKTVLLNNIFYFFRPDVLFAPVALLAVFLFSAWGEKSLRYIYTLFTGLILMVFVSETTMPGLKNKFAFDFYIRSVQVPQIPGELEKIPGQLKQLSEPIKQVPEQFKDIRNPLKDIPNPEAIKVTPGKEDRPIDFVECPVTLNDPLHVRVATAFDILLRYLKLCIVPYPLSFYYGYNIISAKSFTDAGTIAGLVIYLLLTIIMLACIKRHRIVAYGILFYLVSIAPFSTIVTSLPGMMADRYLFIPSLGYCMVVVWLLYRIFKIEYSTNIALVAPMAKYIFVGLLLGGTVLTFSRNMQWKDNLTLMRHDIVNIDQSAQAHNILAQNLMHLASTEQDAPKHNSYVKEALGHFEKTLEIYPAFFDVAYDMGRAYVALEMTDSAVVAFKRALAIDTTYSEAHLNLGLALITTGKPNEAIPYFEHVIKVRPTEFMAYDKLGFVYFLLNQPDKSIQVSRQAAINIPGIAGPYLNMGRIYLQQNQRDSALYYLQKAKALDPGSSLTNELLQQASAVAN